MEDCRHTKTAIEQIETPYSERWAIYCSCGMTFFANTVTLANELWGKHVNGEL